MRIQNRTFIKKKQKMLGIIEGDKKMFKRGLKKALALTLALTFALTG